MTGHRNRLLVAACVVAVAHALPSLYWAAGGRALAWTLGDWALQWQREHPVAAALTLTLIGLAKLAGGAVPLLNRAGRLPWPGLWLGASWAGAVVLVLYGAANVLVGGAVLVGWLGDPATTDRAAVAGHVLLWDPMFLVWGLLLGAGLWRDRVGRTRRGATGPA